MVSNWVEKSLCIVVKTYPTPAKKGVEVSCTAAISADGEWIRLFPVPFRFLDQDKQFKKYQWVKIRIRRSSDPRPESYNIDPDSIVVLGKDPIPTSDGWKQRKKLVLPLLSPSYCALKEKRDRDQFPTLGIFKPKKILEFVIEEGSSEWTPEEKAKLEQPDLFDVGPVNQLEKIPYKFSYRFECNAEGCPTHTFMCSDWEMGQAYRAWKKQYGDDWEKPFRQKFETMMIQKLDTHFYVGTVLQHPANWIIVGLFYPPK